MKCRSIASALVALFSPIAVQAQQKARSDTARLAEVVVTAERAPSAVASAVSAVTRVSGAELARMPHVTLADVLRMAPGFSLVDFDGLGYDPQLMARKRDDEQTGETPHDGAPFARQPQAAPRQGWYDF